MENFPRLVGLSDIVRRWVYTRAGVQNLIKNDASFPKPVSIVNDGKTRLWMLAEIEDYERGKPWLTNEAERDRYVANKFRSFMYGRKESSS
jgi:hypothetical protein